MCPCEMPFIDPDMLLVLCLNFRGELLWHSLKMQLTHSIAMQSLFTMDHTCTYFCQKARKLISVLTSVIHDCKNKAC